MGINQLHNALQGKHMESKCLTVFDKNPNYHIHLRTITSYPRVFSLSMLNFNYMNISNKHNFRVFRNIKLTQ